MPTVKDSNELKYVMRTDIIKRAYKEISYEIGQIVEKNLRVSYQNGIIYITIYKDDLEQIEHDTVCDMIEETSIYNVMEDEFSNTEKNVYIQFTNEYTQFQVTLPKYIETYLITGVW